MTRPTWGRLVAGAVAAAVAASSGCAFATLERVEGTYRADRTPKCSVSLVPFAIDAGLTAYFGVNAYLSTQHRVVDTEDVASFAGLAVAALASGIHGIHARRRCLAARAAHDRWLDKRLGFPPGTEPRVPPEFAPPGPPGAPGAPGTGTPR